MSCSEREKIMEQEALLDYQSNPVPAHTIENVIRERGQIWQRQPWWTRERGDNTGFFDYDFFLTCVLGSEIREFRRQEKEKAGQDWWIRG